MWKISEIIDLASLIAEHPANGRRKFRAMGSALAWQTSKRLLKQSRELTVFGDMRLKCYPGSQEAARAIYFNGWPDTEMTFIERFLRPGDAALDLGANIGLYTLFLAKLVGPTGQVLAVEPDETNFQRLGENVSKNFLTNVTLVNSAVSDQPGTAEFTLGSDTGNRFSKLGKQSAPKQIVSVTTIDHLVGDGRFMLCKMDVEGAEFDAFKGASDSLRRCTPTVWLIELTDRTLSRAGTSVVEVQQWLRELKYDLFRYDVQSNALVEFHVAPRRPGQVGDAIAIHRDALSNVQERIINSRPTLSPL